MAMAMTEDQRRRMELLNGIDPGNIRALDALAHAAFPAAETAPTAQRGAATGDKLMSAEVRAPASLRPAGGNRTYGGALPKVGYQEIKETTPGGGTKTSSSYSYSSGGVTEPWSGTMPTVDPFSYGAAPTYGGSQYDNRRDQLLDRLEGDKFSYDPATDLVWQSYQKQYRREGQRAAEDALGRASAMTGGVASSYAAQAASQAGNYYAAQLSDRLPQMYQDAYNRYLKEYERQLGLADTYNGLGQQDYNRYLDTLGQYNTDRNFAYGVYSDDYNRARQQYLDRYQEYLDEQNRRTGERSWEYGVEQDAADRARQDMLDQYGMGQDAMDRARQAWLDSQTVLQNETAQQQALREYEDEQLKQQINNAYKFISTFGYVPDWAAELLGVPAGTSAAAVGLGGGGSTRTGGTGGNPSTAPEAAGPEAEGPGDDEYIYSGTHENGLKKTEGYDQALVDTRAVLNNEKGTDAHRESVVLRYLRGLVSRRVITEYESQMIYALLGFGTPAFGKSSAGNTRGSIGPNNVQMVQ